MCDTSIVSQIFNTLYDIYNFSHVLYCIRYHKILITMMKCLDLLNISRYEPLSRLIGKEYFLHAYGPIYALSSDVVATLVALKNNRQVCSFNNLSVHQLSCCGSFSSHYFYVAHLLYNCLYGQAFQL